MSCLFDYFVLALLSFFYANIVWLWP
eukprot:COSAG02_NODE_26599_length_629_cov_1.264151_1_plen_25_part_01